MRLFSGSVFYRLSISLKRMTKGSVCLRVLSNAFSESAFFRPFTKQSFEVSYLPEDYSCLQDRFIVEKEASKKLDEEVIDAFMNDKKNVDKKRNIVSNIIYSSFFLQMILTWKDCEDDDKLT